MRELFTTTPDPRVLNKIKQEWAERERKRLENPFVEAYSFKVSVEQSQKIDVFVKEQRELAFQRQHKECPDCQKRKSQKKGKCDRHRFGVYEGCSGGAVHYEFIPTGIGVVVKIKYSLTGAELDISDYENW